MKSGLTKTFIDEYYNKAPMRNYSTNKIVYTVTDEVWSIDLAEFQIIKFQTIEDIDVYL